MCKLPFSFPVFYYCAIKPEIPRKQYKTINMLLRGITMKSSLESVEDVPFLDSTPCSAYASGERPIPEAELDVINSLDRSEIVERIKKLPMQSYVRSAARLISYFSEVTPLDDTTTTNLLALAEDKEHIEEFLAEAFLVSLKCPPNRVRRLKNTEKKALECGNFSMFSTKNEQSTPSTDPEDVQKTDTDNSIFFPNENDLVFDYVFRRKRLTIEEGLGVAQSYVHESLLESVSNIAKQDAVFYITEEACNRFIDEFTNVGKAVILEFFDNLDGILRRIKEDAALKQAKFPLCLIEVPLDISPSSLASLEKELISLFNHKNPGCYGLRKSSEIATRAVLRMVLVTYPVFRSDIKTGRYRRRIDRPCDSDDHEI